MRALAAIAVFLVAATPAVAGTSPLPREPQHLVALNRLMVSLAHESMRNALAIKDSYDDHLELLYLKEYEAIEGALATGGLVPLPLDRRFNLMPRLVGPHPIGEKDLENQRSYIAARPFTVGCLLEIASRVKSGPIEITSLVRHGEYQNALLQTNTNARTEVPTHTMGLAFDIALINTPLETVTEIRDVLQEMRDAGDLLFIGERNQLVFHVVPHPSRLGHFMDLYNDMLDASAIERAQMVSIAPVTPPAPPAPRALPALPTPPAPSLGALFGTLLMGATFPAMFVAFLIGRNGRARSWKGCCTDQQHENAVRDGVRADPHGGPDGSSSGA